MPLLMDCASGASAARLAEIRAEAPRTILGDVINYSFPEFCSALGVQPLRGEDVGGRRIVLPRPKFLSLEEARRDTLP